jgi:hypothetical protein
MRPRIAFTLLLALLTAAPASAFVHTRVVYVPATGGEAAIGPDDRVATQVNSRCVVSAPAARIVSGFGISSEGAAFGPPLTRSGRTPGSRQVTGIAWDPAGTSVLVGFEGSPGS